jgi:predicted DNA-binding antitoxin AbrB/MazE fold protein
MTITVEAVYENGTLKLKESLPFKEHEQVQVTVRPLQQAAGYAEAPPYASDRGVWAGKMPDIDLDADSTEMRRQWEKSLELPQ